MLGLTPMRRAAFIVLSAMAANGCGAGPASSTGDGGAYDAVGDALAERDTIGDASAEKPMPTLSALGHLIVIYLENRSFDHLYGSYPGAEGLSSSAARMLQIDLATGLPYPRLPKNDPNLPEDLLNAPFDITRFLAPHQPTDDPVHRYHQEIWQINGGKMDKFVTWSNAQALTVGYYPTEKLPLAQLMATTKDQVTVCDHFFHAAFGGSFLNHIWLIAAATPVFPNAPESMIIRFDRAGNLLADSSVTSDGYVVNTALSVNPPLPAGVDETQLVPNQTFATIGDRLSDAGVDWAWYSGGWNDAISGRPDPVFFSFHHQPFVYFGNYAAGTEGRQRHLKDEEDFLAGVAAGRLPPVSFVKPLGTRNEHPGVVDLITGENHVVDLVRRVIDSPLWNDTAIIVTYDENGGFWDHVAPPVVDRWGPGTRVPTIVFSPFAKGGVDATPYDTTAILKLIEKRWSLPFLSARDAAQADMSAAFKFGSSSPPSTDASVDADASADAEVSVDANANADTDASANAAPRQRQGVPPVPGGMQATTLTNAFAYIPPQCYAKTRPTEGRAHNPCYACHQRAIAPNFVDDAGLQLSFRFPRAAATNPWQNVFEPPHLAAPPNTDEEILAYVRTSNYFDDRGAIAVKAKLEPLADAWDGEGDGKWNGYVPDAWFRFDDHGFDVGPEGRETGWRAFAYYPFLGTFFPTNGSMDDVLIRLDPVLRQNTSGQADRAIYEINLAIVEALTARHDVAIEPTDEAALGVDLDLDGKLGRCTRVAFDARPNGATRMRYVGRASVLGEDRSFPIGPGLFPLGTEFLHSVRYLDVENGGSVVMAPRMKELRYAKKVSWLDPRALRAAVASEAVELEESVTGARKVLWEHDRGIYNGQGWLLQGFIEAADGSLRPQSYEESVYCAGCHGGIGATTDSMFAFSRKLGFDAPARGWFHWTQHGLRGLREPRRRDGALEYQLYLQQNGAGDEFRENDEVRRKFFDERGRLRAEALARLRNDIAELLLPSRARALDLDRAYRAIVEGQTFSRGREVFLAPARQVLAVVPPSEPTGVGAAVRGASLASSPGREQR